MGGLVESSLPSVHREVLRAPTGTTITTQVKQKQKVPLKTKIQESGG